MFLKYHYRHYRRTRIVHKFIAESQERKHTYEYVPVPFLELAVVSAELSLRGDEASRNTRIIKSMSEALREAGLERS